MSHRPRTALVAALCLGFACLPLPAAVAAPSLDALQVSIGEYGLQWGMFGGDVETDEGDGAARVTDRGTWTVEPERDGDRLRLRVTIVPPDVNPVLGIPAASLVTGVGLEYGRINDGGDIGYGHPLGFSWTPVGACTGDPCAYQADVIVRLRPARRFIASTPAIESPVVVIGLTLLRTFGRGAWVQMSQALSLEDGRRSAPVSKLSTIEGWVPGTAVVPSGSAQLWGIRQGPNIGVDELMDLLGPEARDGPQVPTVTLQLDVRADGCGPQQAVQLHDAWGTLPLAGSVATVGPAGTFVAVPERTVWSLAVGGTTIGEVDAADGDQVVEVRAACAVEAEDGSGIRGTVVAMPAEVALPAAPHVATWLVSVEAHRVARPSEPSLAAAFGDGFLVIERTDARGWVVDRSSDGRRWSRVRAARLPAALRQDRLRDPRVAAVDDRLVLAGIVQDGRGGHRFAAWSATDARTWSEARVRHPSGRPPATSLVLRSLVASDGRWFALADGDGAAGAVGWSSTDGRLWDAVAPRTPEGTSLVAVSAGPARLLGIARPDDPTQPDLLVSSADGRDWTTVLPLPVDRAATVSLGETSTGDVVVAFARTSVAPIEVWVTPAEGGPWTRTLDGSVGLRLHEIVVRDRTVVVPGSVRFGTHGLESSPWVALSEDGGATWRAEVPVNGYGDGRCSTVAAVAPKAAIVSVSDCSGIPIPRWRTILAPSMPVGGSAERSSWLRR